MPPTATHLDIPFLRLRAQRLTGPRCAHPADVVRHLGALQAQDEAHAHWAVGVRTQHATARDVERAIEDRSILRTWPMRGTIHLVPAEDARWMLALCAARVVARDARRQAQLGLDAAALARSAQLLSDALSGGRRLPRADLMALLDAHGIATAGQRGYHVLWYLAQTGLICFGPTQDRQPTFVLLDEWVPHPRTLSRDEALAELAARYVAGHGPATAHDLARWAGLTLTEARAGLASATPSLVSRDLDGTPHWLPQDAADPPPPDPAVHLLPGFDEYLLGYADRTAVLPPEHAPKIVPGANGVFLPTVVLAGQVVGTWKRRPKKTAVELALAPFDPLPGLEASALAAARRYADFLGLPLAPASAAAKPTGAT